MPRLLRVLPKPYLRRLCKRNHQVKEKIGDGTDHHGSWCVRVFWHQLGTRLINDLVLHLPIQQVLIGLRNKDSRDRMVKWDAVELAE
jgi:hypothetical protein